MDTKLINGIPSIYGHDRLLNYIILGDYFASGTSRTFNHEGSVTRISSGKNWSGRRFVKHEKWKYNNIHMTDAQQIMQTHWNIIKILLSNIKNIRKE